MTAKFTLIPNPTFKVDVAIPRAGAEDGVLTFTFKHKTRTELEVLENTLREATEKQAEGGERSNAPLVDFVLEIAKAWALPDKFTKENVLVLLENYPRAFDAIAMAYTRELMALREKN
ncbi:phage tail assembly chaperone [Serratia aquatilis]|uniref:Phage tail assembly chaperone n=1 Tax=Serratia aquatilis TaxID=1737515 RepID=A0ABV6E9Y2_9GAMM